MTYIIVPSFILWAVSLPSLLLPPLPQPQVTFGKVSYYCDKKGVLSNVCSRRTPSISQYLHTDSNLVMEAHHLLTLIPVTTLAGWVKGPYEGNHR